MQRCAHAVLLEKFELFLAQHRHLVSEIVGVSPASGKSPGDCLRRDPAGVPGGPRSRSRAGGGNCPACTDVLMCLTGTVSCKNVLYPYIRYIKIVRMLTTRARAPFIYHRIMQQMQSGRAHVASRVSVLESVLSSVILNANAVNAVNAARYRHPISLDHQDITSSAQFVSVFDCESYSTCKPRGRVLGCTQG